jgi:hypothetical protein
MKRILCFAAAFSVLCGFQSSRAATFVEGSLVVLRFGDGSATLSSVATAAFLDEFTITGSLMQTIAVPTTTSGADRRLTVSGSATSEGLLQRSADGQFLTFGGYDAPVGTTGVATTTPGTVNRVIARVDASGVMDTTTTVNNLSGNIRGVVTDDGTRFWASSSSSGVGYVGAVGDSSATQLSSSPSNVRAVDIFFGQLYISSASGTFQGVSTIGTGLPTTSGQTTTLLPGFPTASGPSAYQFFVADLDLNVSGVDTIWVADDRTTVNGGGIQRWSFDGTDWSLSYTLATGGTTGARGLTVDLSDPDNPIIYATTAESNANRLIAITDSGQSSSASVLATAPANTAFRGVDFAPIPEPTTLALFGLGGLVLLLRRRNS